MTHTLTHADCRRLATVARGSHEQWKMQNALATGPEEKGKEGRSEGEKQHREVVKVIKYMLMPHN